MATAFVTGAGVRVGRAVALALAEAGYTLALHAHASTQKLEAVAREARARGAPDVALYAADLADAEATDALARHVAAQHPALDVVVHNAGLFEAVPFARVSRAQYRRMLAVNVDAPFFLTQGLLPALRAGKDPLVVHVTDVAAERVVPGYAHYTVSKAGLTALTRALAVELAGEGVRVNGVAPGTVAFPEDFSPAAREAVLARIPLGREGSVEDVARAVLFLAREAPYVTGQVLAVDGGRSALL